jgi:hypothetical protein
MAVIECRSGHSASSGKPREWLMRGPHDEVHRGGDAA